MPQLALDNGKVHNDVNDNGVNHSLRPLTMLMAMMMVVAMALTHVTLPANPSAGDDVLRALASLT